MALCYQPNIVAKDLQFAFDAANPKCYPGSGNLIYSLAGNGITGGLENGTLVSSNLAGYFAFDGSDDFISTNFQPNYDYITVNVWFWSGAFSTFGTNTCVVANSQVSSPYPSFDIRKRNTGALQLQFAISSSGSEIGQEIGFINDYTWYNVQFTYDGNTVKCWLNGLQVVSYPIAGTLRSSTSNLFIGKNPAFAGRNAAIYVSQVFIYNRALTDAEIARNYSATKSRYTYKEDIIRDNLILNIDPASALSYPGSGTVLADMSGYNYHPTLVNGPTLAGSGLTSSILLDGSNDYIQIASAYTHTFTAGTTVDVWVKFNASNSWGRLLDTSDGAGTNTAYLTIARWGGNNEVVLESRSSTTQGTQNGVRTTTTAITNGTIQNFTFVIGPGSTDAVSPETPRIYMNANLQATTLYGTQNNFVPYVVNKYAWIGRSAFSADAYLGANIYAYKIYNRALSAAEVKQNFQSLRGRYGI
mgnify:CR=1 FL=1|jgi:hypothetical protein